MAFIYLENGWRDESTEGPGVDILQTKYVDGVTYTIVKYQNLRDVIIKINSRRLDFTFKTLDAAKQAVENYIKNSRT